EPHRRGADQARHRRGLSHHHADRRQRFGRLLDPPGFCRARHPRLRRKAGELRAGRPADGQAAALSRRRTPAPHPAPRAIPFADPAHLIPATSRLRRSRTLWRVLFFIALAVAVLAVVARLATDTGTVGDRIARIDLFGTVVTDPARLEVLEKLAEDPLVKAV